MDGKATTLLSWITKANIIEVPFFQRPYVWDDDDFKALTESFIDSPDGEMPFFGSVIMKKVGDDADRHYLVIDGQQRITTFNVLIRVLLDLHKNEIIKLTSTLAQTLSNSIYNTKIDLSSGKELFTLRLIPSNSDKSAFEKIMDVDVDRPIPIDNLKNSHIENAYSFFYNFFMLSGSEMALKFALKLYNDINNSMIFIVLDDKDDEQKIFDSVNSLGKALTNSDIIKNYIFQKMKEFAKSDNNRIENITKIYEKYWDKAFYYGEKKDFWYKEFTIGRISTDHLECFLRDLAVVKKFYAAKKTSGLYGLCKAYKAYIDNLDYDSLYSFVKEISEYADVYYRYKTEYLNNTNFIWSDFKNRLLLILDYLETSTFNPYLLKVFKENPNDIENKLYNLERFFLFRFFYDGTTKNYNQCCEGLINALNDEVFFDEYLKESPVTNKSYKDKFRKLSNKQGLLVMFLIEMQNRNDKEDSYSDGLNIKAYTLEHVMPQSWKEHWMNVDSYSDNGDLIDKNDTQAFIDNRNKAVKSLGNFALLTSKLNSAVSNDSFEVKINGNGKKKGEGMKHFAAALSTTKKIIDVYDNTQKWDERNIYANEKEYFEQLNKFYKFE